MKRVIFVISCFCFISLSAQTITAVGKTSRWQQYNDDLSFESLDSKRYTPKSKLLRVSENEVVFPVFYDNSSGVFVFDRTKFTYGVVKLNNKGEELWQQKTDGLLVDISMFGKNILVISTDQKLQRHVIKEIKVTLLDGSDGKILQQKTLLTNSTENFIEVRTFNNLDGDIMALMLRYTNYKGGMAFGIEKKFRQSVKMELYSLNEKLEARLDRTISVDEKLKYMRSDMADNGNLFLLYEKDDEVIVDKYAAKETNAVRLSTPYKMQPESKQQFLISINSKNEEQIACAINGFKLIRYAIFQFDKKNVLVKEEPLTDNYAAEINSTVTESEDFEKRKKMKHFQYTEAKYIKYYDNNLVVAKEIMESNLSANYSTDYETIVSVFDESLSLKKHFVVLKEYYSKVGGYGDSYYIGGDHFYSLSNNYHKAKKTRSIYACIDLKNLQWKKLSYLRDTNKKIVEETPLFPSNTIWFQDNFLIDRRDFHWTKGFSSNTNLEVASHD